MKPEKIVVVWYDSNLQRHVVRGDDAIKNQKANDSNNEVPDDEALVAFVKANGAQVYPTLW